MKKLLFLSLSIFLLSCSKGDRELLDPIVGTWKYTMLLEYPENGGDVITRKAGECQLLRKMTFTRNNVLITTDYAPSFEGGCKLNPYASGDHLIWEKLGENQYKIKSEAYPTGSVYHISFYGTTEMRLVHNEAYTRHTPEGEVAVEKSEEVYNRI